MATLTIYVYGGAGPSSNPARWRIPVTYTYSVSNTDTTTTVSVSKVASGSYSPVRSNPTYDAQARANALSALKSTTYKLVVDGTTIATQGGISAINKSVSKSGSKAITKTHSAQTKTIYFNDTDTSATISVSAKPSYTVIYNANSGSGQPANQTKWYGESLTLSTGRPVKEGYTFKGWATSTDNASNGIVNYVSGASYTSNSALTLYAVWELIYSKPNITNFTVERCDANGNDDDEGGYAKVRFNWSVFRSVNARYYGGSTYPYTDNGVSEGSVSVGTFSTTFTSTDSSGSESFVIGDGSFSTDSQYDVEVSIIDSQQIVAEHTSFINGTLSTSFFPMDFNADGTAMGIFMPAPDNAEGVYLGKDLFLSIDTTATSGSDKEIYDALVSLGWTDCIV